MTTQTQALAEFLLARIAEDEALAQFDDPLRTPHIADCGYAQLETLRPCTCRWPARLRAEAEAKRGIIGTGEFLTRELRWLTLPYADHPDFREEWRP